MPEEVSLEKSHRTPKISLLKCQAVPLNPTERMDLVPCRSDVFTYKSNLQLFALPSFLAEQDTNNSAKHQSKTSLLILLNQISVNDLIKLPKVFGVNNLFFCLNDPSLQEQFCKIKGYLEEELDYRKQALDQAYMVCTKEILQHILANSAIAHRLLLNQEERFLLFY